MNFVIIILFPINDSSSSTSKQKDERQDIDLPKLSSLFFIFLMMMHELLTIDAKGSKGVQLQPPVNYWATLVLERGSTWRYSIDVCLPMTRVIIIKMAKESIHYSDRILMKIITTWPTVSRSWDRLLCHDLLQMSLSWLPVLVQPLLYHQWLLREVWHLRRLQQLRLPRRQLLQDQG